MIRGLILAGLLGLAAGAGAAQVPQGETAFALDEGDTVRTNIWLIETLMSEAIAGVLDALPAAPATVVLMPQDKEPSTTLLTTVITDRLGRAGYTVHLDKAPADAPVVCQFHYKILELSLAYPQVGRRLGIWRQWVGREVVLTGMFTLTETASGRVLFNDRVRRVFRDRVPADDLASCQSATYTFTKAEPLSSGWQRRLEQVLVLGTLAGLIAVYFQNVE